MRTFLVLLLVGALLIGGYTHRSFIKRFEPIEPQALLATGGIFIGPDRTFHCSGTEIGHTNDGGGIFLTARHCVANLGTNKIEERLEVSFSLNQKGPFYEAAPIAISLTDDVALLYLRNGADIPEIQVHDERGLSPGESIFNASFPLGTGKHVFHGEYMGTYFPAFPAHLLNEYPVWEHTMPMNLTIAHGSSGSGVFSEKKHGLIGVAVGTFAEGSYNIAVPADRVLDFLHDLQDNTVTKFIAANPEKEEVEEDF